MKPELSLSSWIAIITCGWVAIFLFILYLPAQLWLTMSLLAITLLLSGAILVAVIRRI